MELKDFLNRLGWEKRVERASGTCMLVANGVEVDADWVWGTLSTGRCDVFSGYYVVITADDGTEALGTDAHSLRRALRHAATRLEQAGFDLYVWGLSSEFRERGLTGNSGWGEVERRRAHMFEGPSAAVHDVHGREDPFDILRPSPSGSCDPVLLAAWGANLLERSKRTAAEVATVLSQKASASPEAE